MWGTFGHQIQCIMCCECEKAAKLEHEKYAQQFSINVSIGTFWLPYLCRWTGQWSAQLETFVQTIPGWALFLVMNAITCHSVLGWIEVYLCLTKEHLKGVMKHILYIIPSSMVCWSLVLDSFAHDSRKLSFLAGGGRLFVGGGTIIFLEWSKGGTSFFFQWAKGEDQNFLRPKEGGPTFFLQFFSHFRHNSFSNTLFKICSSLRRNLSLCHTSSSSCHITCSYINRLFLNPQHTHSLV